LIARICALAILLFGLVPDRAAGQIGAAHWRPEDRVLITDFGFVTSLARSSDRLFAATSGGLLINRDVFRRWEPPVTREDGWPDVEVTAMAWQRLDRLLWLALIDGRLLALDPDGVRWSDELRLGRPVDRIIPDASMAGGLYLRTPDGWLYLDTFTRMPRQASRSEVDDAIARNPDLRARRELISSPGFESVRAFIGAGPDGQRWPISDVMPSGDPARFWIASAGAGLSLLDSFSFDWAPVGVGLLGAGASALAGDGEGIWIAPVEPLFGRYGITRVSQELDRWEISDHRASPIAPDRGVRAMAIVDGRLWAAGDRGVTRRETDGSWTRIAAGHFDRGDVLQAIAVSEPRQDGRRAVWIGGERSLDRMADSEGVPVRIMSGSAIHGIHTARGGAWVASDRGLLFADDDGGLGPVSDLPAFEAGAVTGHDERIWAAIGREVWEGDSRGSWRRLDEIGALSSPVTAIAFEQGVLWVGSADELVSWEIDARGPTRRYTFAAGDLPLGPFGDRGISQILPVSRSRAWIATPAGALRLDSPY
jgi:hypothetical protein